MFKYIQQFIKSISFKLFDGSDIKDLHDADITIRCLETKVLNPGSLFLDIKLDKSGKGFYVCSEEEPFESSIGYIDVSKVIGNSNKIKCGKLFLNVLKEEVKDKGSISSKGNWSDF